MDSQFDWIDDRMESISRESLLRELIPRQIDPSMQLLSGGCEVVNFGSNDYLGLAHENTHRSEEPSGAGASPLVCGFSPIHEQLQDTIAQLEATESSVLFPSGYAANVGLISCLAGAGDVILSDELNHASIIDGCRLSKAERYIYRHADVSAVESLMQVAKERFRRRFIVTDGVFSMDGDFAPLVELCELADRYDAILIVDEAHGTGVLGEYGAGLCEHLDVKTQVPLRVGTLSKAVGAMGGFVAGPERVTRYLINHARSLIYSTALPPSVAEAAMYGLTIIKAEPERRERLTQNCNLLRRGIASLDVRSAKASPIIAVMTGQSQRTLELSKTLWEVGFYVPAIRPPTVPKGQSRLRISVSSTHSEQQLEALCDTLLSIV